VWNSRLSGVEFKDTFLDEMMDLENGSDDKV
jgi:hypothetical protein